jgi:CubicO group peptidase (beta-lactamase class C family)
MTARRLLIVLLAALLCACGGGGGGGYASGSPAPAPPTGSPPPPPAPVTIIDIAQPWAKAAPADVNMDEVMLGRASSDAAAMPRFRSLLVARHGKLVAESYYGGADSSTVFDLRSVTKSVVSMLTGIAVQSGKLPSVEATVGAYIDAPYSLDANDRAVTVRQLLTMSSRYQWNENSGDDYNQWVLSNDHVQFLLDRRQTDPAGTFTYNSAAVNLLGLVLQDAVAKPLPDFANEVLFQPIGVTTVQWEQLEPDMVNAGSGIKMTATDLLRFGQLLLQRGRSGTRQIVPESWIDAGTTPQYTWRETYGAQRGTTYGYLWWVAQPPATTAAFAWGFGGQFAYVVPSLDLVVVATTQWQGISAEVNPTTFAGNVLTVIVNDILPAAR